MPEIEVGDFHIKFLQFRVVTVRTKTGTPGDRTPMAPSRPGMLECLHIWPVLAYTRSTESIRTHFDYVRVRTSVFRSTLITATN